MGVSALRVTIAIAKESKAKKQRKGGQDKSTVAEERLSGCLHIQELALSNSPMFPRSTQCYSLSAQLCLCPVGRPLTSHIVDSLNVMPAMREFHDESREARTDRRLQSQEGPPAICEARGGKRSRPAPVRGQVLQFVWVDHPRSRHRDGAGRARMSRLTRAAAKGRVVAD